MTITHDIDAVETIRIAVNQHSVVIHRKINAALRLGGEKEYRRNVHHGQKRAAIYYGNVFRGRTVDRQVILQESRCLISKRNYFYA